MRSNSKVEYINKHQSPAPKHSKLFYVVALAFVAVISVLIFQIVASRRQLNAVNGQIASSKREYNVQRGREANLKSQVKLLHNKDYLQKLVRSKFYYTKKGETVYSFPENSKDANE